MDEPIAALSAISRWIVCICGFRQERTGPTGMEKTWRTLRAAYERPENGCRVSLHNWNDPWDQVAAQIVRLGPADRRQFEISIVAYSWGMGHGAVSLCRELQELGLGVRSVLSIDGVYHNRWALWRARWSPFFEPVITVPEKVQQVHMFRQEEDWPRGHAIAASDPDRTELFDHGCLGLRHDRIDDSFVVRKMAMSVCRPANEPPRRAGAALSVRR